MRLRSFTASDMPSAMKMVRDTMGDDAIIIASEPFNGKKIKVTAALDHKDEGIHVPLKLAKPASAPAFDPIRFEVQDLLRFHNLPEPYVAKLLGRAEGGASLQDALHQLLAQSFHFEPLSLEMKPQRIMLVGTPGIGKTLTIAKLATYLSLKKQPLAVITTDNKRAGGVEQLQAFTSILGLDLKVAHSRAELWKYVKAAPGQHVLIDTAGCNPFDPEQLTELTAYACMEDIEPILALPASGDSMDTIDMIEAFSDMPIKRLLVTRADSARRFGSILAAAIAGNLSFCDASSSASVVDTLKPLDGTLLATFLTRYRLQSL